MLLFVYIKDSLTRVNTSCGCHPEYDETYLESKFETYFFGDLEELAKTCAKITIDNPDQEIKFILVTKDNIDFLSEKSTVDIQTNSSDLFSYLHSYNDDYYDSGALDTILEKYTIELKKLQEEAKQKELEYRAEQQRKAEENKKQKLAKLAAELGVKIDTPTT